MKTLGLLSLLVIFGLSTSFAQGTKTSDATATPQIEVIDFYGTHRCMTCKAIEANTKYTLDTYFKDELESGQIEFKMVNVDDEDNYDIAEKFEATGTALFLNVIVNGEEDHHDLTTFAFDKGNDKSEFSAELKEKIDAQLKSR